MKKIVYVVSFPLIFLSGCQSISSNSAPTNSLSTTALDQYAHIGFASSTSAASNKANKSRVNHAKKGHSETLSPFKSKQVESQFNALSKTEHQGQETQVQTTPSSAVSQISDTLVTRISAKSAASPAKPESKLNGQSRTVEIYQKITANYGPTDTWERLRQGFRLPNLHNESHLQGHFEKWYSKQKRYFHQISERGYWYLPYILQEVERRGMPAEIALLPAIESKYTPEAISRSKAKGIWQFMAPTARHYGLAQNQWVDARSDLVESTQAALNYLQYLHKFFDGDWILAIAAYNGGEGTIQRALKRNKRLGLPAKYTALKLSQETTEYVHRLLAMRNIIQAPDKYNVELQVIPNQPTLSIVDSGQQIDLEIAASLIPLSYDELKSFNVAYKQGITPPEGPHHIAVPSRYELQLRTGLDNLPVSQYMRWDRYIVNSGDVLGKIADQHGTSVNFLKQVNNLRSNTIRVGQTLKIPRIARNTAESSKRKIHIVKQGDSLSEIARRNGVSLSRLVSWNKIGSNSVLRLGQQILIPE